MAWAQCGPARAAVIRAEPGARLLVSPPGTSRTVEQFAVAVSSVAAVNGGLFDGRERPMGPARGGGRDWPRSRRVASAGVVGGDASRFELVLGEPAPWMTEVVSGWPALVREGVACTGRCGCPRGDLVCTGPAPRTAVAMASRALLLVVVEAPGLTLSALASLLVALGAERALNLDGGGSTALAVQGRTVLGGALPVPVQLGVR